jgi:hypothetical protein
VAESVDSVEQVREIVDLALLRQDNVLWQSIAKAPIDWANLGRRVHSPTIYKEGIIHIVGTWNNIPDEDKSRMHESIYKVCERKAAELSIAKEALEMRILGHYPAFLCRLAAERPGRPSYANDIYMWMSICFFRQWFAQAISDNRTRMAPDGGYVFYNCLAQGGQAYLHHEDFQNFHQYFPMSSKACNVLEANMGVLKEDIKQFVKDLVEVRVHIKDDKESNVKWLTCAKVEKEDYPWYVPYGEEEARGVGEDDGDEDEDEEMDESDEEGTPGPSSGATIPVRGGKGKGRAQPVTMEDDDDDE